MPYFFNNFTLDLISFRFEAPVDKNIFFLMKFSLEEEYYSNLLMQF